MATPYGGIVRAAVATDPLRGEFVPFGAPVDDATGFEIVDDDYVPPIRRSGTVR